MASQGTSEGLRHLSEAPAKWMLHPSLRGPLFCTTTAQAGLRCRPLSCRLCARGGHTHLALCNPARNAVPYPTTLFTSTWHPLLANSFRQHRTTPPPNACRACATAPPPPPQRPRPTCLCTPIGLCNRTFLCPPPPYSHPTPPHLPPPPLRMRSLRRAPCFQLSVALRFVRSSACLRTSLRLCLLPSCSVCKLKHTPGASLQWLSLQQEDPGSRSTAAAAAAKGSSSPVLCLPMPPGYQTASTSGLKAPTNATPARIALDCIMRGSARAGGLAVAEGGAGRRGRGVDRPAEAGKAGACRQPCCLKSTRGQRGRRARARARAGGEIIGAGGGRERQGLSTPPLTRGAVGGDPKTPEGDT